MKHLKKEQTPEKIETDKKQSKKNIKKTKNKNKKGYDKYFDEEKQEEDNPKLNPDKVLFLKEPTSQNYKKKGKEENAKEEVPKE